jgi:hypothetical protein
MTKEQMIEELVEYAVFHVPASTLMNMFIQSQRELLSEMEADEIIQQYTSLFGEEESIH